MDDKYLSLLKQYWGYTGFRGIQRDIIESIGNQKDTLGLMPTGGGKSVTFQVPAMACEGLCLVITPLIALMKDQVHNLRRRGIKAAAIYSGLSRQEIIVTLENCIFGGYKFLYISPERLSSDVFLAKLSRIPVSFITVDEAHCISQWGYDFRPSYMRIAEIRTLLPKAPVLALTATATPEVVADIQRQLNFRQPNVFRMSFERPNLSYVVRHTEDKPKELLHILRSITGSAIVYTRSRKGTREIANELQAQKITATFYHAGLTNVEKDDRQQRWQAGELRVMVATNAFGMGIDKPDVRIVIHMELPDSPEAYFQEAGRAGRDGNPAYAVLLYHKEDRTKLSRRVPDTYPDKTYIRNVYENLCYYYQLAVGDGLNVTYIFNLEEFCRKFRLFPVPVDSSLRLLTRAGYIEYTDEQENASRLMFLIRRDELYRIEELNEIIESVLQWVLRSYGGVFSDYIYIDESLLAKQTSLTQNQVYESLQTLARRGILHYIPRRKCPFITFTRQRVDTERIYLSPAVYEERKQAYIRRIEAMMEYASGTENCRSRTLLYYFGERNEHNCLRCDVCLNKHASGLKQGDFEEIRTRLLELINDDKHPEGYPVNDIEIPGIAKEKVAYTIRYLLDEEQLIIRKGLLLPAKNTSPNLVCTSSESDHI